MAQSTVTFTVRGLDAESDADDIEAELESLEGVMGTEFDEGGEATVRYDEDLVAGESVVLTVEEMGHDVEWDDEPDSGTNSEPGGGTADADAS